MNNVFICDTNVLVSSLFNRQSPPRKAVDFIRNNGFFAFSEETFTELLTVLKRDKFDKFSLREERLEFAESIKLLSHPFQIKHQINICRDPKDNKFLDVAIASYAEYLITGDEDLLVLESIGNTSIITPREFISVQNIS